MIINSELTASDVKERISSIKKENNIDDIIIRHSINDFYSLLYRFLRQHDRKHCERVVSVEVPADGYDLSQVSDIGSLRDGFLVYTENPSDPLTEVEEGSNNVNGYYIRTSTSQTAGTNEEMITTQVNKLFLSNAGSSSVKIKYQVVSPKITEGSLANHRLLIDRDMEQMVYNFALDTFYDGEYQEDQRQKYEEKYYSELELFFNSGTKCRVINGL